MVERTSSPPSLLFLSATHSLEFAILGSGGIGKIYTALLLIHRVDVSARYGYRQYFVRCDAFTSANSLALQILQILGPTTGPSENAITALHRVLASSPPNPAASGQLRVDLGCERIISEQELHSCSAAEDP